MNYLYKIIETGRKIESILANYNKTGIINSFSLRLYGSV